MNIRLRDLHGPSLWADHAAVLAEFERPLPQTLPAETIASRWQQLDSKPLWATTPAASTLTPVDLSAIIAAGLQHPQDPEAARVAVLPRGEGQGPCVLLGCLDPQASRQALRMAIAVSMAIFRGGADLPSLAGRLRQVRAMLQACLPQNPLMRTLVGEAGALGIPVAPVGGDSRVWLFGQGARGVHFHQAATDGDSLTGIRLAMNKLWSNQLVISLGFPGMTHALAADVSQAVGIARELGYPVVVKPLCGRQGRGVSAYVLDEQELAVAFATAASLSPEGVLVERHIAGEDHRLTVFGGKLTWADVKRPARVIGDGERSVADLISAENERRRQDPQSLANGIHAIEVNDALIVHLRKQGFSLESCLPAGRSIALNSVANIARGGTFESVIDQIHPDNRDMAESLARAFRMESFGIDFQTPDISRSWRDVPCGVIEVNGTPGIVHDSRVQQLLRVRFPGDSDGRIPTLLLVDPPAGLRVQLSGAIAAMGLCVGETDAEETALGGMPRCRRDADLVARVKALICDPACEGIVIETTATAIAQAGLVLDRVDLVVAPAGLDADLERLLRSCSGQVIVSDAEASAEQLLPALRKARLLVELAEQGGVGGAPRRRRGSPV